MIYDVVIVGSGFGGAVIASRFGQNLGPQKKTVLVLGQELRSSSPTRTTQTKAGGIKVNASKVDRI